LAVGALSKWQAEPEPSWAAGEGLADVRRQVLPAARRRGMLVGMAKHIAKLISMLTPMRRWAQFSLATLLLVVTVLCVVLSLVVVPAERQRRAVAAIEALGGVVGYEESDQSNETLPRLFRCWLPRDYFDQVRSVLLPNTVTDAGLAHLHGLTGLERLWLNSTQITDAGLAQIHGLTGLKWISFSGIQVTDAGRAKLRQALPSCRINGQ